MPIVRIYLFPWLVRAETVANAIRGKSENIIFIDLKAQFCNLLFCYCDFQMYCSVMEEVSYSPIFYSAILICNSSIARYSVLNTEFVYMCYKFHTVETSLTSINLVYLVYKIGLVFLYIAVKDTKQAKASLKLLTDYVSSCSCMWKKSAVFDDFKGVF